MSVLFQREINEGYKRIRATVDDALRVESMEFWVRCNEVAVMMMRMTGNKSRTHSPLTKCITREALNSILPSVLRLLTK